MPTPAADIKSTLRRDLLAARRMVPRDVRESEARALSSALVTFVSAQVGNGATVCAYVPVGSEPGSVEMLDALAATGVRVLLPVTPDEPAALLWSAYAAGELASAAHGLLEPTGPRLAPETIAEARVVIIPALAVDRRGVRLGRGAGYYDRTLPLRDPAASLVAVVRDSEFLDEVPAASHDVSVTHVATPQRGVVALG
jgi:5-formyltetrahydrofolate cyclo-ligase